jgi:hypothetical protein
LKLDGACDVARQERYCMRIAMTKVIVIVVRTIVFMIFSMG